MKKHHAFIVKWRDSASIAGWKPIDSPHHGVAVITSIGWLLRQTKTDVTISTSISDNACAPDALTIPRESVTKMVRLKNYIAGN